jgi:predicted dehydrogenase
MTNVAVIGAGYMGTVHLETLRRVHGVHVKWVIDANDELSAGAAERFSVPRTSTDYREALADTSVEVVHVCTNNSSHFEISREAVRCKKSVLSEKPLALTSQEGLELSQLAQNQGVTTGVDFCYRYYPAVLEMRARIKRGDCGEVRMATGTWFQDWLSQQSDYSWRLEPDESGNSNIASDLGSHWFDLVQFVTGLDVREVQADFATLVPTRLKPKKQVLAFQASDTSDSEEIHVALEDYASVLFRLSNGAPGSFTTSQTCNGRKSETEFQIYGSECSYAWNHSRSNELWIGHRHEPNQVLIENPLLMDSSVHPYSRLPAGHPLGYFDAVLNLFRDFYGAVSRKEIDSKTVDRPTFATAYHELAIVDSLVASQAERKWTRVEVSNE